MASTRKQRYLPCKLVLFAFPVKFGQKSLCNLSDSRHKRPKAVLKTLGNAFVFLYNSCHLHAQARMLKSPLTMSTHVSAPCNVYKKEKCKGSLSSTSKLCLYVSRQAKKHLTSLVCDMQLRDWLRLARSRSDAWLFLDLLRKSFKGERM